MQYANIYLQGYPLHKLLVYETRPGHDLKHVPTDAQIGVALTNRVPGAVLRYP
jgi:hypothetical protein